MENINYFEVEQEDAVMGIARSAVVCLHALLEINKRGDCPEVLAELFKDFSRDKRELFNLEERYIVENLNEILFEDRFENFRNNLIDKLNINHQNEQAAIFQERLAIARSLPSTTRGLLNQVINLLKESKEKFLEWLFMNVLDAEHYTTQLAISDLTFNYLPNIYGSVNYPPNHGSGYFISQNLSDPSSSNLSREIGLGSDSEEVIKLIQMLSSGILVQDDYNYIWKIQDGLDINSLDLSKLKQILLIAKDCDGEDLSEKISFLLENSEDQLIVEFKYLYLYKIRLEQFKFRAF